MSTVEPTLILKLQKLPPQRLAEVADFVEFLAARHAAQTLLVGAARIPQCPRRTS